MEINKIKETALKQIKKIPFYSYLWGFLETYFLKPHR